MSELFIVQRQLQCHIEYSWYTGRWWVACYIWYSEEGTGRGSSPPRPLLAVPNVTAHPSTASIPITILLYNDTLLCGFNVPIKGLTVTQKKTTPVLRLVQKMLLRHRHKITVFKFTHVKALYLTSFGMSTLQMVVTRPRIVISASTCSTERTSSSTTVKIIKTARIDPAKNAMCLQKLRRDVVDQKIHCVSSYQHSKS